MENNKRYKRLVINNILFESVLLFESDNCFEVVDSWSGKTIAKVKKDDIKTMVV